MKVEITKIFRTLKDKQGGQLKTKDGRAYERVSIKTKEYGDKYISGFGNKWNETWKEGDIVDIDIKQKGEYLNFFKIDPIDELTARVKALEDKVFGKKELSAEDFDVPF
jgi:hypothetical protein